MGTLACGSQHSDDTILSSDENVLAISVVLRNQDLILLSEVQVVRQFYSLDGEFVSGVVFCQTGFHRLQCDIKFN